MKKFGKNFKLLLERNRIFINDKVKPPIRWWFDYVINQICLYSWGV